MLTKEGISNFEKGLREMGRALRAAGGTLYDLNMTAIEMAQTPGIQYRKETTLEVLMEVARTLYNQWQIWTFGVAKMEALPNELKRGVLFQLPNPAFRNLTDVEQEPFIVAAIEMLKVVKKAAKGAI